MITGPIQASVDYETPLPGPKRVVEGKEEKDNFQDEQALTFSVDSTGAPGKQWPEPRLGPIRPRLDWSIETVKNGTQR
jgi:hypothetical protein